MQTGILAFNGEYWTVGWGRTSFSLKNVIGLGYIYCLLQCPGQEFHALDLETGNVPGSALVVDKSSVAPVRSDSDMTGLTARRSEDSGPVLDPQAKLEYRRRIAELKEELDELRQQGDHERGEKIESEIEFITQQLAQAVGLGGRDRRAGSTAERARLNVSRAIRAAIQKITEHDTSLGEFLGTRVKTGSFCSYLPTARVPVDWKLTLENIEPSAPLERPALVPLQNDASFLQPGDRTTFVGREGERDVLRTRLKQAKNGEGRVVVIAGPPGIGKTRISREAGEEARQYGFIPLAGNCYDRDDSIPFLPFIEVLETALGCAQEAAAVAEIFAGRAGELSRLLPQLQRLLPNLTPPPQVSPEQSRRVLFNAVQELIARQSARSPLLLLLEDLHWADEGTLSLLVYLAQSIGRIPVIIIATHRDDDIDVKPPLTRALEELTRLRVIERIPLRGLPHSAVARMIEVMRGREPSPALVDLVYSNSDGNPLFVEELMGHLEQGRADVDSSDSLERAEIALPHSLRLVIGRRLRLVNKETMRILGTAALIGRSCTFRLLEAATHADPDWLVDAVEEAEKAGLISSELLYPEAQFTFAHELIRRAVLDEVSIARRQRLHLNIGEAVEALYSNEIGEHVDDLAHHYWSAGAATDPAKAIRYLQMAGEKAMGSSANNEAVGHFKKGLQLLSSLGGTSERLKHELLLQTNLGTALIATKGFASQEVEEAYAKARELSQRAGETPHFFRVLFGLWLSHASRGEYETALELGKHCLRLAETAGDADLILEAHHALGVAFICVGDPVNGLDHLERAVTMYDPRQHAAHAQIYGHDPAVVCLMHASWALWLMGLPDQAIGKGNESLALARKLDHPSSSATAAAFVACLHQWCGNVKAVEELSASAIAISNEHDFAYYRTMATILAGWALVQRGKVTSGIAQMRQGLDAFQAIGAVLLSSYFSGLLAEAYAFAGNAEEGLRLLGGLGDEMEVWWKAELCRLKGELILRQSELKGGTEIDRDEAASCFAQALAVARVQKARSLELRAAVSQARLLLRENHRTDAYDVINEALSGFREGFETRDLRVAQSLLAEL